MLAHQLVINQQITQLKTHLEAVEAERQQVKADAAGADGFMWKNQTDAILFQLEKKRE